MLYFVARPQVPNPGPGVQAAASVFANSFPKK